LERVELYVHLAKDTIAQQPVITKDKNLLRIVFPFLGQLGRAEVKQY